MHHAHLAFHPDGLAIRPNPREVSSHTFEIGPVGTFSVQMDHPHEGTHAPARSFAAVRSRAVYISRTVSSSFSGTPSTSTQACASN